MKIGLAHYALAGHRSMEGLRGDISRCAQYGLGPSGAIRCITLTVGPGSPDDEARIAAGITGRYRYKTGATQTRGRPSEERRKFTIYPKAHWSQDIRRVKPGSRVAVPAPKAGVGKRGVKKHGKAKTRAVAGLGRTLPPSLRRMQFTKADGAKCGGRGLSRREFALCMARARDARIGR